MNTVISVIGGDLRQATLASLLQKDGYITKILGFDKDIELESLTFAKDIEDAAKSDVVIFPLPASYDNETINAPFSNQNICIRDILKNMPQTSVLLGGRISEYLRGEIEVYGVNYCDYFKREELTVLNAIPTAEGAIEIALSEMPITLHSSRCLVLGFGRIGKVLSKMLFGIGADVTVEARKFEDLAWIKSYGYRGIHICELAKEIGNYDIIFNTIPNVVLDRQILRNVNKRSLIIDLASKPGGVDFETAKELGIRVIWALSLPGKVAPVTSGEIIKNTVVNILNEMGV
ncbi:MAG: dipicolinate synthase subunit DpsA [Clostridia bacterium]|nr:dipicolinate synthase subunit DpsA [Clostridia bacterium]